MAADRTQRVTACPLCDGTRRRRVCRGRDRQHDLAPESFIYARCGGCGVVYQAIRPPESQIASYYPDDYAPYQSAAAPVRADTGAACSRRIFHCRRSLGHG